MDKAALQKALQARSQHCARLESVASALAEQVRAERQRAEQAESALHTRFKRLSDLQALRIAQLQQRQTESAVTLASFKRHHGRARTAHARVQAESASRLDTVTRQRNTALSERDAARARLAHLRDVEQNRDQLEAEVAAASAELTVKAAALEAQTSALAAMRTQLDASEAQNAAHSAELARTRNTQAECDQLSVQCDRLQAGLAARQSKLAALERALVNTQAELDRQSSESARALDAQQRSETQLSEVRTAHARLSDDVAAAREHNTGMAQQLQALDAVLADRASEHAELSAQRDRLQQGLASLECRLDTSQSLLESERSAHAARVAEDAARLTELEDQNAVLADKVESAQRDSDTLANELRTSTARVEVLKSRLNNMGEALARAANAVDHRDALQRELHALQTELADIDADNARRLLSWENQQLKQTLADAQHPTFDGTRVERRRYASQRDPNREAARKAIEHLEAQQRIKGNKRALPSPAILKRAKSKLDT
ncbi:MAG: hypothetical protein AAF460_02470 [Pseudomonadota bacterium]